MESTFVMVQLECSPKPEDNLKQAQRLVKAAKDKYNADFVIFPETFMSHFFDNTDNKTVNAVAEPLDGPFASGMLQLAKEYDVWLTFGMKESFENPDDLRVSNTVVMADNHGEIIQVYRKTHLYDAFNYHESEEYKPGDHFFEPVDTPFGKIGLFVCYEVRFPEVARYQKAKGAEIILMPTDWYKGDLKSFHFKTLISARAIENTVFILACDQCGGTALGESLAVDPMGVAIASAGEVDCLVPVYVDTERIKEVEKKLPSFKDRRKELYQVL